MKNGRKTAFFVALTAVALAAAVFGHIAFAQSRRPGLLPTNPFYFAKEGLRNLRRALTFDQTAKAELELRFLEERAAEIKKIIELKGYEETLVTAIAVYKDNLETLTFYLRSSSDRLLPKLVSWSIRHNQLFADLGLSELEAALAKFVAVYFDRTLAAATIAQQPGSFRELRAVEILQSIAERPEAAKLIEDLLITFVARVKTGEINLEGLLSQPGNLLTRIQAVDEARLRVEDGELKSHLNIWRQRLLEVIGEKGLVTAGLIKSSVDELEQQPVVGQVKYLLLQGKELFEGGNYLAAFGYLVSARAAIRDEVLRAVLIRDGWSEELALLKASYDEVVNRGGGRLNPTLATLAGQIITLSDLARNKPASSELLKGIREVKLMLNVLRAGS